MKSSKASSSLSKKLEYDIDIVKNGFDKIANEYESKKVILENLEKNIMNLKRKL